MDFDFTPEQREFLAEVEAFLDEHATDPDVADPTRENMAQIVDTPERRAFMKKMADRGWFGITWPEEYGGKDGDGVYEYLLNEALARRGAPQIGKGVGIVGKTILRHGSDKLKKEFLPKILNAEIEFAVGYSEPNAGSDAASMKLKAVHDDENGGWRLTGQKIWTTSAHFADWYWVGARTHPELPKHAGITLFLVPMDHPGLTIKEIWTMGDERTNEVFFDDVFVPGRLRRRRARSRLPVHLGGPRPRALHDVHVLPDQGATRPARRPPQDRDTRRRAGSRRSRRPRPRRRGSRRTPRSRAASACASSRSRSRAARRRPPRRAPTSCSRPSSPSDSPTRRWISADPVRSCASAPKTHR